MTGAWELARDAVEVHELLLASDVASDTGAGPPQRSLVGTRRRVEAGSVHLLRMDGKPAAMVTLTRDPPFDLALTDYAPSAAAVYMQRLAVHPALRLEHPYLGARAVRRALDVARAAGADVIRAEANPDLARVLGMLLAHGFVPVGAPRAGPERPRVYLEKALAADVP
ncbi:MULTISPECIES: N-acetyltransferase [unclassified Phenylobacterium]|uniref:GNAT family N-acetyltransferase n=1 Tax=unclassified Phenylobacterium TaxID=2640670 RepID=UPI00083A99CA|nr:MULTISPECIES: GNAT family N-acetyltransferase [unclassified Phenylobacterium]